MEEIGYFSCVMTPVESVPNTIIHSQRQKENENQRTVLNLNFSLVMYKYGAS